MRFTTVTLRPARTRASGRHGQFLGLWRLIGDVGISGAPFLVGTVVKAAGLAAASLTVAGLGVAGSLVMTFVVVETLRFGGVSAGSTAPK